MTGPIVGSNILPANYLVAPQGTPSTAIAGAGLAGRPESPAWVGELINELRSQQQATQVAELATSDWLFFSGVSGTVALASWGLSEITNLQLFPDSVKYTKVINRKPHECFQPLIMQLLRKEKCWSKQ